MKEDDKQLVSEIIRMDLGISMTLKGCIYLEEAVIIVICNPNIMVMKLYEQIAERHKRSPLSIERTIRYAIEYAYKRNELNHFFPYSCGKPFNSEVIWRVAELVRTIC